MSYQALPQKTRTDGKPRRVGFELEFTGIDFDTAGKVLQKSLHGDLKQESEVVWLLQHPSLGNFQLELDWSALKALAENESEDELQNKWLTRSRDSAAMVVPMEIVYPPIPVAELDQCDKLIEQLRLAGAKGTEGSPIAAYGVHINTELADTSLETLHDYLRAYALLQWFLVEAHQVDLTRRITPYIDLYPEQYVNKLLSDTPPSISTLIDDYLTDNATRNRALDMLPIFSCLDEDRVRKAVDDDRIKAREAFHYRLPNCLIDQADWQLSQPWEVWLLVEKLATDSAAISELGEVFLQRKRPLLGVNRTDWIQYLKQWLQDRQWV